MAERSAAALHRLVMTLVLWGLTRLFPPSGTRRKVSTAIRTVVTCENMNDHARLVARVPARRRSPYSVDRAPLDGYASRMSRPYLPAGVDVAPTMPLSPRTAREKAAQFGRRTALVLAADFGVDLDTRDIHAVLDGVRVR